MAHSANIISQIKLPSGTTYDIHDAQAIHSVEELGLSAALVFKGTKEKGTGSTSGAAQILAITSAKVGDVWLDKDTNTEYVCVKALSGTADATAWEKMGNIHDAASSTHTHSFSKTVSIPAVNVTGSVTVPTVSATASNKLSATATKPSITVTPTTDTVLGTGTTFTTTVTPTTTNIKATASGVAVGANGTAAAITGFGDHTTAAAISSLATTTIKNPTVTAVSIPNVTGNSSVTASKITTESKTASKVSATTGSVKAVNSVGTLPSWSAAVSNGVLEFTWGAGSLPTTSNATVVTGVTSTDVTFDAVKANTDVSASKVTLGTALSASSVTTSNVTVATGSNGTINAITELGEATTANALTGVKVTAQPTVALSTGATAGTGVISVATGITSASTSASGDNVTALTGASAALSAAPTVTIKSGTTGDVAYVSTVSVGSTTATVSGTTTAQNVTVSGDTGQPK